MTGMDAGVLCCLQGELRRMANSALGFAKGFEPSTITATRSPEVEGHTPVPLGENRTIPASSVVQALWRWF